LCVCGGGGGCHAARCFCRVWPCTCMHMHVHTACSMFVRHTLVGVFSDTRLMRLIALNQLCVHCVSGCAVGQLSEKSGHSSCWRRRGRGCIARLSQPQFGAGAWPACVCACAAPCKQELRRRFRHPNGCTTHTDEQCAEACACAPQLVAAPRRDGCGRRRACVDHNARVAGGGSGPITVEL
jgi:hypothetical protein